MGVTLALSVSTVSGDNSSMNISLVNDTYNTGIIDLMPGWNLISVPRRLNENNNKGSIFSNINSSGRSIWTFDMNIGGWKMINPEDIIYPLNGYFIYSSGNQKILLMYSVDPLQVPPVKDLQSGWNLIGFSGSSPASARDALLSIRKSWTQIINWDPVQQKAGEAIINGGNGTYSDTNELKPMKAYWVNVDTACSLASIGA